MKLIDDRQENTNIQQDNIDEKQEKNKKKDVEFKSVSNTTKQGKNFSEANSEKTELENNQKETDKEKGGKE